MRIETTETNWEFTMRTGKSEKGGKLREWKKSGSGNPGGGTRGKEGKNVGKLGIPLKKKERR